MVRRLFWKIPNLKGDRLEGEEYDNSADLEMETAEIVPEAEANIVSSLLVNGKHAPALDIDGIEVRVLPSTTEGNYHLYIDKPMEWEQYKNLLSALRYAGIIEDGYYRASIRKGQTFLRKPGVLKGEGNS